MKNKIILSVVLVSFFYHCDQIFYQKTPSGIEYRYITKGTGKTANEGDHIFFKMERYYGDSLAYKTPDGSQEEFIYRVNTSKKKFKMEDIFAFAKAGDSIFTRVLMDSISKYMMGKPLNYKPETYARIIFKIDDILSKEEAKNKQIELSKKQIEMDKKVIEQYVKNNKLKGSFTNNGVFVSINKEGNSNKKITEGSEVSLYYVGKLLDGTVFDKNWEDGKPIKNVLTFTQGAGQLIPGFEEGILDLNYGSEATIIIPSSLAYGEQGAGSAIPPNSIIMFDLYIQ